MGSFWESFWDKACDAVDKVEKHTMDRLDRIDRQLDYKYDEVNRQINKIHRMNTYNTFGENMEILFESKKDVNAKKYLNRKGPKRGDIVGVIRYFCGVSYEHYAVYAGNGRVIHYTGTDYDSVCIIRETSFEEFLDADINDEYFLFDCEGIHLNGVSGSKVRELYSASETVNRARSRLGEKKYNVVLNNCEHFAIWCKTGNHVSHQVNTALLGDKYWKKYEKEYMYE